MITPEYVRDEHGEFIFVANHSLETEERLSRSIEYNRARILHARLHLPLHLSRCRLIYDVRGQEPGLDALDRIALSLADVCTVEFKR